MDIQGISSTQPLIKETKRHLENQGTQNYISNPNIDEKIKMNPEYIPSIAEKSIIRAIEEANKKLAGKDKTFEISIHEKTKQIMIKVLDSTTNEVIKEIPSEKILDMVASMCEAAGLLIDKRV